MDRIGHMLHLDFHGLAGSGHQHLYAGIHPVGLADLLLQRVGATLLGDQRGKRPRSIKLGVHQRDHGLGSEHRQQGHIIRVPLDQFVPKQALCVRWRNNDVYRADLSYGAWIKVTVRLIVPAEREPGESARMCASSGTQRASGSATRGWQQPLSNHQRATIYHQPSTINNQRATINARRTERCHLHNFPGQRNPLPACSREDRPAPRPSLAASRSPRRPLPHEPNPTR